jgi:hypothetical protein
MIAFREVPDAREGFNREMDWTRLRFALVIGH